MPLKKNSLSWTIVFFIALALRLGFSFYLNLRRPAFVWDGDARQYQSYATHLLRQGRYEDDRSDPTFRMPGYPLFLASIYRILGESSSWVQITQSFLGAVSCVLLFFIGESLYGEGWGLFCGLALAIYYDAIEPSGQILSEALAIPLLAFFWWLWFCWEKPPKLKSAVLAFVCAALCFARPDFGLFAVVLCLGFPPFFIKVEEGRRFIKGWIWGLAFVAVFSPWIIRNWDISHRFIPASGQGEAGLYMGLALPLERFGDIGASLRAPKTLGSLKSSEFYRKAFTSLFHAMPPFKIVRAYLINLLSLFYPFLPSYDWTYIVFIPLWLWALFKINRTPPLKPLWLMVGLYIFVHVFFGGPVSRYRQVLSPALILAATAGAYDLFHRFGPRFWRWFGGWVCLNLAIWAVAPDARLLILTVARGLKIHS